MSGWKGWNRAEGREILRIVLANKIDKNVIVAREANGFV
jgi:hypothetical protein